MYVEGTAKALDQHRRIKHERTSVISSLVPDTSVCRICSTDFFSRARLISHLVTSAYAQKLVAQTVTFNSLLGLVWSCLDKSAQGCRKSKGKMFAKRGNLAIHM